MSRVSEFIAGASDAVQSHVDGIKQIAGFADIREKSPSRTTAESVGVAVGESALFLASGILARKIPVVGQLADGKLASIVAGGLMGATQPLDRKDPASKRLLNAAVGGGTMGILEFGPAAAAKLPGVFSRQNALVGSVARAALVNGAAGAFNSEMQSVADTGKPAGMKDLLSQTAAWMVTGAAVGAVGFKLESHRQKLSAAQQWQEDKPWKYKSVIDLNASDLKSGERLSPGNYRIGYESQGKNRSFDLYISDGAAASQKAPLTTFLHGLSVNGGSASIVRELEFNRFADQSAAIVAYPHALPVQRGLFRGIFQAWNDRNFGFLRNDSTYSDIVSYKDMLGVISRLAPYADTGSVALGGFSLGGKMAHRIAANLDNVSALSTVHSTIDSFDKRAIKLASQRHPIDVQIIHGRKDSVLPFEGGKSMFTALLSNAELSRPRHQAEFWAASNRQLTAASAEANAARNSGQSSISFDERAIRMRRFNSPGGYEVAELVTADGAHRMHGAQALHDLTQILTGYPLPPSRFDARQEVWQFLMNSLNRSALRKQSGGESALQISRPNILRNSELIDDKILDFGRKSEAYLDDKFAEIYRAARRSIGRVSSEAVSSTGFVVSKDGAFLATDHAIFDGQSTVSLPSGVYRANLLARQRKSDLALLMLEPNKDGEIFAPLKVSERPVRLGEKGLAAGFPVLDDNVPPYRAMSGRLFSHNSEYGNGSPVHAGTRWDGYFMRSAGGASGSPVMDRTGAVTGIVSFHKKYGNGALQINMTGAIGAPIIRRFVGDYVNLQANSNAPRDLTRI